jgi:hypothetical protein
MTRRELLTRLLRMVGLVWTFEVALSFLEVALDRMPGADGDFEELAFFAVVHVMGLAVGLNLLLRAKALATRLAHEGADTLLPWKLTGQQLGAVLWGLLAAYFVLTAGDDVPSLIAAAASGGSRAGESALDFLLRTRRADVLQVAARLLGAAAAALAARRALGGPAWPELPRVEPAVYPEDGGAKERGAPPLEPR